jgi:hypothetical protein
VGKKTIVVGNGVMVQFMKFRTGAQGKNTSFTYLNTAIGGGGGGSYESKDAGSGGSGGEVVMLVVHLVVVRVGKVMRVV